MTILWILAIIGFAYVTLMGIFEESIFYLSSKSKVLSYYEINDATKPFNQSYFHNDNGWDTINIKEFVTLLKTHEYILTQSRDLGVP